MIFDKAQKSRLKADLQNNDDLSLRVTALSCLASNLIQEQQYRELENLFLKVIPAANGKQGNGVVSLGLMTELYVTGKIVGHQPEIEQICEKILSKLNCNSTPGATFYRILESFENKYSERMREPFAYAYISLLLKNMDDGSFFRHAFRALHKDERLAELISDASGGRKLYRDRRIKFIKKPDRYRGESIAEVTFEPIDGKDEDSRLERLDFPYENMGRVNAIYLESIEKSLSICEKFSNHKNDVLFLYGSCYGCDRHLWDKLGMFPEALPFVKNGILENPELYIALSENYANLDTVGKRVFRYVPCFFENKEDADTLHYPVYEQYDNSSSKAVVYGYKEIDAFRNNHEVIFETLNSIVDDRYIYGLMPNSNYLSVFDLRYERDIEFKISEVCPEKMRLARDYVKSYCPSGLVASALVVNHQAMENRKTLHIDVSKAYLLTTLIGSVLGIKTNREIINSISSKLNETHDLTYLALNHDVVLFLSENGMIKGRCLNVDASKEIITGLYDSGFSISGNIRFVGKWDDWHKEKSNQLLRGMAVKMGYWPYATEKPRSLESVFSLYTRGYDPEGAITSYVASFSASEVAKLISSDRAYMLAATIFGEPELNNYVKPNSNWLRQRIMSHDFEI